MIPGFSLRVILPTGVLLTDSGYDSLHSSGLDIHPPFACLAAAACRAGRIAPGNEGTARMCAFSAHVRGRMYKYGGCSGEQGGHTVANTSVTTHRSHSPLQRERGLCSRAAGTVAGNSIQSRVALSWSSDASDARDHRNHTAPLAHPVHAQPRRFSHSAANQPRWLSPAAHRFVPRPPPRSALPRRAAPRRCVE
jgi:hypothetical protein